WGEAANRLSAPFTDTNVLFLGYVTLSLAIVGAVLLRRRLAGWSATALALALLTLGPILHINGVSAFRFDTLTVNYPMPYVILQLIPFVKANRFPHRYGLVLTLCLAVLAGGGLAWVWSRWRWPYASWLAGGLVGLVLFEHLAL